MFGMIYEVAFYEIIMTRPSVEWYLTCFAACALVPSSAWTPAVTWSPSIITHAVTGLRAGAAALTAMAGDPADTVWWWRHLASGSLIAMGSTRVSTVAVFRPGTPASWGASPESKIRCLWYMQPHADQLINTFVQYAHKICSRFYCAMKFYGYIMALAASVSSFTHIREGCFISTTGRILRSLSTGHESLLLTWFKVPAWICNHISSKMWDWKYLAIPKVWEWISNFNSYFTMDVITYSCWD